MASREARTFVLAAVALVAVAAMFVWALAAPESPDTAPPMPKQSPSAADLPPPPPPPPPTTTPSAPAATATPAPANAPAAQDPNAINLFAGPMPEWMADFHARATAGKWLHVSQQKQIYEFGQQHKDDARPQLLLAWDSVNREWWGFAVRLYKAAYDADPRAKDDPTMLRDLVEIASRYDRTEYRESTELIAEAYGNDALPRIDMKLEELRRSGDVIRTRRLERLRNMIEEK